MVPWSFAESSRYVFDSCYGLDFDNGVLPFLCSCFAKHCGWVDRGRTHGLPCHFALETLTAIETEILIEA
jgi:hypothetical protein